MFIRDLLQPWHLILLLFLGAVVAAIVLIILAIIRAVSRAEQRQQPRQVGYQPTLPYGQPPTYYRPSAPSENDPAAILARAKAMLDQGLISQTEYDDTKRHVLAKMQQ